MSVLDREALEQSPLADLHAIASELSIDSYRLLRREQLVEAILARQDGADVGAAPAAETAEQAAPAAPPKARRRRSRQQRTARAEPEPAPEPEPEPEPAGPPEPEAGEPHDGRRR